MAGVLEDIASFEALVALLSFCESNPTCPKFNSNTKMHKDPPLNRWLTNAGDCVFSPVADIMQAATAAALERLHVSVTAEMDAFERETGLRPKLWPSIETRWDAVLNLPRHAKYLYAFDISRAYEAIPLRGGLGLAQHLALARDAG